MFAAHGHKTVKTANAEPAERTKVRNGGEGPVQANLLWFQLATGLPLQTKLVVSQPGDPYEQEADRVADQVMRTPAPTLQPACATCAAGEAPCAKCKEEKTGLVQRRADRVAGTIVKGENCVGQPLGTSAAPSVVQRQPVDDVQKPPAQPTTFPPQEAPKQGQEKEDYEKERLLEGAKKAAGELAKYLWGQFSTSQTGKNILDKNEHDLKPLIKFFEDFAASLLGKIILGAASAGGGAGAFVGAQSARTLSNEADISPSTGGPVPRILKDEKFFSLELKWDFVTPPAGFTLKTPWVDTPPLGGRSSSGSPTSLPPPPPLLTFKPIQIPRICTPADPNGDQGEADMRSAIVYAWLQYRQEQEKKRQEELLKKYADWPKPGSLWGQPSSTSPVWQPSVLKPLFKRQAGMEEIHNPQAVDTGLHSSGQSLDPVTHAYMRLRFGRDFSNVRVHTSTQAAESAHALNARAYTLGQDIVFGSGQYQPETDNGRRLLTHELTHVVQQRGARTPALAQGAPLTVSAPGDRAEREADQVSAALDDQGALPPIVERPTATLARATFDVDALTADTQALGSRPIYLSNATVSSLFFKHGHTTGELARAADYPTTFTVPADKSKPASKLPKADATPPLSNTLVEAHFFSALRPTQARALVLGGFHGDEHPGRQVTEALVSELSQAGGAAGLAFHTIVVPRVNAGAIEDELKGVKLWRNRCNRQLVDLNRNFPTGNTPKDTDCKNTDGAPIQPEVQAVMNVITKFKPDRIVSTHAISTAKSAGVFADPNQDPQAIELARGMASTIVNPSDRAANKLGPGVQDFNPVYPGDKPGVVSGGTSLGAWGPTAVSGRTTPVITMEAPGFTPLGTGPGSDPRTVKGFVRPLRAFLGNPKDLATAADRDILADIDAFTAADILAFLTGLLPKKNDIFRRVRLRVDTAIAKLNAMTPPKPITNVSDLRLFAEDTGKNSAQAKIIFDKFFLVDPKGWDTLPDQFFKNGKRSDGVDRAKWLGMPSKDRLLIILKFSSLPGTSRHHWGTEVDLNSTEVVDWQPAVGSKKAGNFFALGQWLQVNASKAGLLQSYTPGRTGGYSEEAWHYSYAPISLGLRDRYNQKVTLTTDVIDKVEAEFQKRAKAAGETVPSDFAAALKQINISDLVNNIGPGL